MADFFFLSNAIKNLILLEGNLSIVFVHFILLFVLAIPLVLHYYKYVQTARILYGSILLVAFWAVAFYVDPHVDTEYYLLLIPIYLLLFFDNRVVTLSGLFISIIVFLYDEWLLLMIGEELSSSSKIFNASYVLFILVYLGVDYFKSSNELNEQKLERQKDDALKDSQIIIDQKEELEKLSAFKSHFFVNLSHEIRTPLTLIEGYNENISGALSDTMNPDVIVANGVIKEQSGKIKTILDGVVDLAKMDIGALPLHQELVSMVPFLKRIIGGVESLFERNNVRLHLSIHLEEDKAYVDPFYMERVVNNMLNNALQNSNSNSVVEVVLFRSLHEIIIEIKDQGVGIPPEELTKVFERFYTLKNSVLDHGGGSGIGLAFAKEIVELHHGEIKVESELGKGTCFKIELPSHKSPNQEVDRVMPSVLNGNADHFPAMDSIDTSNFNILIVEDNPDMMRFIKVCLKKYRCYEACDGVAALGVLSEVNIDLVLSDYMMPKMDGYELVENIREKFGPMPVIMLTARMDDRAKLEVLNQGANDYLTKPFYAPELRARVNNLLTQSQYLASSKITKRESIDENDSLSKNQKLLRDIKCYIEEHASDNVKVSDLTDSFYLSKSTLQGIIQSETGLSVNVFIKEVKLQLAKRYLDEGHVSSVKEMAIELGYAKHYYFAELFEQRFGIKLTEHFR